MAALCPTREHWPKPGKHSPGSHSYWVWHVGVDAMFAGEAPSPDPKTPSAWSLGIMGHWRRAAARDENRALCICRCHHRTPRSCPGQSSRQSPASGGSSRSWREQVRRRNNGRRTADERFTESPCRMERLTSIKRVADSPRASPGTCTEGMILVV